MGYDFKVTSSISKSKANHVATRIKYAEECQQYIPQQQKAIGFQSLGYFLQLFLKTCTDLTAAIIGDKSLPLCLMLLTPD